MHIVKLGSLLVAVDACEFLNSFLVCGVPTLYHSHTLDPFQYEPRLQTSSSETQTILIDSNRSLNTSTMSSMTRDQEAVEGYLRVLVGCLIGEPSFSA